MIADNLKKIVLMVGKCPHNSGDGVPLQIPDGVVAVFQK